MNSQDPRNGLNSRIHRLALPVIGGLFFHFAFNFVDMFWVGRLGSEALAAVSAAQFVFWTLLSAATIPAVGLNALLTRRVGAKDVAGARKTAALGMGTALILGGVLFFPTQALLKRAVDLMGLENAVAVDAQAYLRVILAGTAVYYLSFTAEKVFTAHSDTRTPFVLMLGAITFNAILDPVLIFGIGVFPALGVSGAALATVTAEFIYLVAQVLILYRRGWLPAPGRVYLPPRRDFLKILRIGIPQSVTGIIFSLVYVWLTRIISAFGNPPIAALGIGHRIEYLSWIICQGYATAASTLVGQNLGGKQPRFAQLSVNRVIWFAGAVTFLLGIIFFRAGEMLTALFTEDLRIIANGGAYLRIMAFSQVFMALEVVLEGAFAGAGNTLPVMAVSVPLTVARIPLAWLLAYSWLGRVEGVWWAISLTTILKGASMIVWFSRGRWKRVKL